jgi:hypothetical protein
MGGPTILRLSAIAIGWTREKSKIEFLIAYRSLLLRFGGKA